MPPRNVGKDSEPGSQAVAGIVSSTCEICDSRTAVGGQPQPSIRPLGAKPSPRRGLAGPRDRRGRKGGGRGEPAGRGSRSGPGPFRALEPPTPPRGARGRRRGRTLAATVTSGIVSRFVCSMAGSPRYPVGEYSILRPLYSTCTLLPPAPPGPAAAAPGAGREPAVRQRVRFAEFCCCCCAHPGGGEGLDAPGGGGLRRVHRTCRRAGPGSASLAPFFFLSGSSLALEKVRLPRRTHFTGDPVGAMPLGRAQPSPPAPPAGKRGRGRGCCRTLTTDGGGGGGGRGRAGERAPPSPAARGAISGGTR